MPNKTAQKPKQSEVFRVLETLSASYPDHKTELKHVNPYELLVAVILSAQCTDAQVNTVTPNLFAKYKNPQALAKAKTKDVEALIHSCGFFRNKTKSIINCSKSLVDKFKGAVPKTMEELTSLDGVGRKTASVVMNQAFDLPAIAVDTHVKRVSNRLGWAHNPNPDKIEFELKELVPEEHWSSINGLLILHGRRICKARNPQCPECEVKKYCQYYKSSGK